jgi:hypothetical protein
MTIEVDKWCPALCCGVYAVAWLVLHRAGVQLLADNSVFPLHLFVQPQVALAQTLLAHFLPPLGFSCKPTPSTPSNFWRIRTCTLQDLKVKVELQLGSSLPCMLH